MCSNGEFEVVVVGSCMMDFVTYSEKLPQVGETILGLSFEKNFGGKGANQAVQCGRLGVKTAMCGVVDSLSFGGEYIEQLGKEGVETMYMHRSETLSTGIASITVDSKGQNSIIIVPGANLGHTPDIIKTTEEVIKASTILVCQNEINFEATMAALQCAKANDTISIFNPAPVSANTVELLPFCDVVCPNETELSTLSGGLPTETDAEIEVAANKLLEVDGVAVVIVTLGSRGACIVRRGVSEVVFIKATKVNAVDTVGAGDSFIGSLASNIARGSTLTESVTRAIHCASISVTRKGAQKSYPYLQDLNEEDRPLAANSEHKTSKDEIKANLRR